jgi:hypothetical protein
MTIPMPTARIDISAILFFLPFKKIDYLHAKPDYITYTEYNILTS